MDDKIPQTTDELNKHLSDQLGFLKSSAIAYDKGNLAEAKRMALALRILLHDTQHQTSLLSQLGLKDRDYIDTSTPDASGQGINHQTNLGLAYLSNSSNYIPKCYDASPGENEKNVDFQTYWMNNIIKGPQGISFSRKDIVLELSETDGGAHVDSKLKAKYHNLTRENSLGILYGNGTDWQEFEGFELAVVRQIAHEILTMFDQSYKPEIKPNDFDILVGGMAIGMVNSETIPKVGRNEPCPCGAKAKDGKYKKYKHCHGR